MEEIKRESVLGKQPRPGNFVSRWHLAISAYWEVGVIVALAILLWWPRFSGPIDLRWDAGVYYVLGTALATGQGYRILSEPGSPEVVRHPPLLPAFVALHQKVLGTTDPEVVAPWLRKSYAVIFFAYGLAVIALSKRYLPSIFALVAAMLCLLHFQTIFLSDGLVAELPFALVSVLFALFAGGGFLTSRVPLREAVSFLFAVAGFLLRAAGLALFAAWVIEALIRRRWLLAVGRAALALIPITAWQAHVARVRGSYEYNHTAYEYQRAPYQFYNVSYAEDTELIDPSRPQLGRMNGRALASRIMTNFQYLPKALGETLSASDGYWHQIVGIRLDMAIAPILAVALLILVGTILLAYRGAWLIVLIIVASIGLICTTPWHLEFRRYLMPLASFLAISTLFALERLHDVLRVSKLDWVRTGGRVAISGFLLILLAVQGQTAWSLFRQRELEGASFVSGWGAVGTHFFYHDQLWRGWEEAIAWIGEHSRPDAIVATSASHFCYLRIGRRAVAPPVENDLVRARQLLRAVPVSYVIVDRGYSLPAVETDHIGWPLVQSFDGTRVYEYASNSR